MRNHPRPLAGLLFAGALSACTASDGNPAGAAPLPAAPMTPAAQTPVTPVTPNMVVPAPSAGTPAVQAGASAPAVAGGGGVPSTPMMMDPPKPTDTRKYPDACVERRASWSTPCHDDPDPCGLHSGYPGDQYCLLPPPQGKGVQIHFGPKNYADPAEIEKYLLEPGEEQNAYAVVNIPTTEEHWYSYVKLSMRPGSHHMINTLIQGHPPEGFVSGGGCDGQSIGGFVGTQTLILESPPQGIPAPENEGLGRSLPGNASICQNYHRYNYSDQAQLSEVWYNVWFTEEENITQRAQGIAVIAGPFAGIPPGTQQVISATRTLEGEGRIISMFGHRHAATERFAVFLNDALVYDSWDWVESRVFNYDSITQNPAPNPAAEKDGAASGTLPVKRGDKIKFECHVNNTTDKTLTFRNELYTGEMCILFGSSIGVGIN